MNTAASPLTAAGPTPLLEVCDVVVAYAGILALKGVSLRLHAGERVCLIGANGAGKTSLLKAIAGLVQPFSGEVRLNGVPIQAWPPHERVAHGVALVPEGRGLFTRLSVLENLQVGAYTQHQRQARKADLERVLSLLPRLRERLKQTAGTLSGGEQQMLAIGRALLSRPRVLLLDEPSMGLAPVLVEAVFAFIEALAQEGTGLLLVEQKADLALRISDQAYVMALGHICLSGPAHCVRTNPAVRQAYFGDLL